MRVTKSHFKNMFNPGAIMPDTLAKIISTKTLNDLKVGDAGYIVDFFNESEAIKKMEAMGLRRGRNVSVLQKQGRGIILKVNNSRIVITSDVAGDIEIK